MKTSQLFHKPMTDVADAATLPPADMEALLSTIAAAKPNTVINGSPIRDSYVTTLLTPTAQAAQAE